MSRSGSVPEPAAQIRDQDTISDATIERLFVGTVRETEMPGDDNAQAKKAELVQMVIDALPDQLTNRGDVARALDGMLDIGVRIKPPEIEIPKLDTNSDLITFESKSPNILDPDIQGGVSVKAGNIRVDMRRLLVAGAQTTRDVVATVKSPWLLPLTALILWDRLWSLLSIEITDKEASVIWTMWMNCDERRTISEAGLLESVNQLRESKEHGPLTGQELQDALERLAKMGCIAPSKADPSRWWLSEWIRVKYR
jgi:hypothetical protein